MDLLNYCGMMWALCEYISPKFSIICLFQQVNRVMILFYIFKKELVSLKFDLIGQNESNIWIHHKKTALKSAIIYSTLKILQASVIYIYIYIYIYTSIYIYIQFSCSYFYFLSFFFSASRLLQNLSIRKFLLVLKFSINYLYVDTHLHT